MVQPKPPTRHTGKHLKNANLILENWRFKTVRTKYTPGLLPSHLSCLLKTLASHSNIQSVHDMKISVKWIFADKHGHEVLALLHDLDKSERQDCEAGLLKRREARKATTAAKREAEKRMKDLEWEQRNREKEAERPDEEQQKRSKVAECANAKVQASAVTKPPAKCTRCEPLHGTLVLNLTPTTPMPAPHVCHLLCVILIQDVDNPFSSSSIS